MPFERGNYHVISTVVSSNLVSLVSQIGTRKKIPLRVFQHYFLVSRAKRLFYLSFMILIIHVFYIHRINLIPKLMYLTNTSSRNELLLEKNLDDFIFVELIRNVLMSVL